MDATTPVSPAERDAPGSYRPLSGLAVAAVVVAGLFALLVIGLAVAGVWTGTPVLWKWPLLLGLLGAGLAGAALWQVRASEGARSGGTLAGVSLGVCVVFGLCYAAFQVADELAVRAQTHEVATLWFESLAKGDVYDAFAWTMPVGDATRLAGEAADPATIEARNKRMEARSGREELGALRTSELVAVLGRAAGRYEIIDAGVRDLTYEKGGYRVQRDYRVHTPEGYFDVGLLMTSKDDGNVSGNQRWQVILSPGSLIRDRQLTKLGRRIIELQSEANGIGRAVQQAAFEKRATEPFLLSLPGSERKAAGERLAALNRWFGPACGLLGLFPDATLLPVGVGLCEKDVILRVQPGYNGYEGFVRADESLIPVAARRRWVENQLFRANGLTLVTDRIAPSLRIEGDDVSVVLPCELPPLPTKEGGVPGPKVRGRLIIGLSSPAAVAELKGMQSADDWRSAEVIEGQATPRKGFGTDWSLRGVEVTNEPVARPDGPGRGGPPG